MRLDDVVNRDEVVAVVDANPLEETLEAFGGVVETESAMVGQEVVEARTSIGRFQGGDDCRLEVQVDRAQIVRPYCVGDVCVAQAGLGGEPRGIDDKRVDVDLCWMHIAGVVVVDPSKRGDCGSFLNAADPASEQLPVLFAFGHDDDHPVPATEVLCQTKQESVRRPAPPWRVPSPVEDGACQLVVVH